MPTPVKVPAVVASVTEHAPDLRSFVLQPHGFVPRFRPGQFLHLALDPYDPTRHWPESRVFSIASSPRDRKRLRITVSRKGGFTTRLFEAVEPGSSVWLKLPYGDFDPRPPTAGAAVFLAGGTGITPFAAAIEAAADRRDGAQIHVHYAARDPELLVYRSMLEQCSEVLAGLVVTYYAESGGGCGGVKQGRIVTRDVWQALDAPQQARFFLSGPSAMIEAHRAELCELGADPDAIVFDQWS